jgi:hypothetical protein
MAPIWGHCQILLRVLVLLLLYVLATDITIISYSPLVNFYFSSPEFCCHVIVNDIPSVSGEQI